MKAREMTTVRVDVPNEELTLAMQESEAMLADPAAKKFDSVEELFADLDAEETPSPRLADAMREALRISGDPAVKGYADTRELFEALDAEGVAENNAICGMI